MLTWIAAEYRKPALVIASLNVAVVGLITLAWSASGGSLGLPASAEAQTVQSRCQPSGARLGHLSPLQLRARVARVLEKEKENRTVEYGFLVALASAVRFSQFERVEELLLEYECGRTL